MSIPLALSDWQYTIDRNAPASLKLTPSEKSLGEIRTAIQRIDSVFAKLQNDAEQRQRDADQRVAIWEKDAPERAAAARRRVPFSEWDPVEFRFVEETSDGPAIPGLKVTFTPFIWPSHTR